MRTKVLIGGGAVVALAAAAVATAAVFAASGVTPTTAHGFTAAKTNVESRTCTGADKKQFTLTKGRYTGSVNFDNPASELDGPLTIDARTTYSTTDGYGIVEGSFRVKDDDTRLSGKLTATLKGTQLVGYLSAKSHGSHAAVVGNVSATFDPQTGFTNGEVGADSSKAVLAVLAGRPCKDAPKPPPAPKPKAIHLYGTVTSVVPNSGGANGSVTITPKGPVTATCYTDAAHALLLNGLTQGKKVELKCESATPNVPTSWMLTEIKVKK